MSVKVSRVRTRVPVSTSLPDLPVHVDSVSVISIDLSDSRAN